MDTDSLKQLLKEVRAGKVSTEKAFRKLKSLPYQNLGFARVDTHRSLRKGFPETIFCQGKATDEIVKIIDRLVREKIDVLATRATETVFQAVKEYHPHACYFEKAGVIVIKKESKTKKRRTKKSPLRTKGTILVITAGTSDIPVAEEAVVTAEFMGSKVKKVYDVGVAGIHRLFDQRGELLKAKVIVVVAGMEGALASVVGGMVECPVIAVPTSIGYGANFQGVAPLLTMLNSCAPGIAVVNIDNGYGAGYMASLIVGVDR
ncbi:MAG: nickel pincer cofactor biosynthesis protein LarB [Nitrospirae bacterium]|nr:nickel pincer cofactor biosynthesis protein LarB [Nitrospirota bacterium]